MFEKNNDDTLPNHQPYDCTIDLEKGEQPPFWPIYNLSQHEIVMFWKYMDENLIKGSFNIPNLQMVFQSCLSKKKKLIPYECVLIIVAWISLLLKINTFCILIMGFLN
jgi:hypothetical protein